MKAKRMLTCSLLVLAGCRTMPAGEVSVELELIEDAIKARAQSFNDALEHHDAEVIADGFGSVAFLLLPDTTDLRKEDLEEHFRAYLQLNPVIRTVTEYVRLSQALDMAWEVGWLSEEHDTSTGRTVKHSRYLTVWEKEGGTWMMASQAFVPWGRPPDEDLGNAPPGAADVIGEGLPDESTSIILPDVVGDPE